MDQRPFREIDAEERVTIFHESYDATIDAAHSLGDIVIAAGDYLSQIIGQTEVDCGMARMVEGIVTVSGRTISEPGEWREALNSAQSNCFSEWALGEVLHDLAAYAIFGIALDGSGDVGERRANLEALIQKAEDFLKATPIEQWGIGHNNTLYRIIRQASNRWALDNGQPIEPAALADFGGVSEGRIRNLMSGVKRQFNSVDGRIPANEAMTWLADRPEFWTSIWQKQELSRYASRRPQSMPLERAFFVPVARDGSAFHPALHRGSGYTIGEKGAELQVPDFEDALDQLQRMPVPYWRRPNAAGNWGIVSGIRWARLDEDELQFIAEHPDFRLPNDDRL